MAHVSCIERKGVYLQANISYGQAKIKRGNSSVCVCVCRVCECTHAQIDSPAGYRIIHIGGTKASFFSEEEMGRQMQCMSKGFSHNYGFSVGRNQEAVVCSWCKDAVSGD